MSIERRSIGSIVDDDAACLMEGDELDDVLSLSNLDPTDGSRMTLGSRPAAPAPAQAPLSPLTFPMAAPVNPAPAHRDSVPRSIVGAGVCNGVPSSSSGSAAQLMARLNSIKQTFSQVSGGAGGPKTPVRSFGGGGGTLARTPAKDTALERKCSEQEGFNMGHGQDSEVEVLMGKSDLPITP